jgi:hypothetical protein
VGAWPVAFAVRCANCCSYGPRRTDAVVPPRSGGCTDPTQRSGNRNVHEEHCIIHTVTVARYERRAGCLAGSQGSSWPMISRVS